MNQIRNLKRLESFSLSTEYAVIVSALTLLEARVG